MKFFAHKYRKYYEFSNLFVRWLPIGTNFSKLWKSDSRPFGYEQMNLSVYLSDPIPRDFSNEEIHCLEVRKLLFSSSRAENSHFPALELFKKALEVENRNFWPLNNESLHCWSLSGQMNRQVLLLIPKRPRITLSKLTKIR